MKQIHFLGECMVELRSLSSTGTESTMGQSFAGDVYNSAVYLKRCFPAINASVVTAVGLDKLSDKMLATFEGEGIDTQYVFRHDTKAPGLYLIETDETGERSFTYWRSDAAARKIMDFLNEDVTSKLAKGDIFFFSGISLAVVEPGAREVLWEKLEKLKRMGVQLVFDPNYRARLWEGPEQARMAFEKALALSDVALPGVEDLTALYGITDAQGVLDFCTPFGLLEVVVKNGPASVVTSLSGKVESHDITPVENVVDTTSAGDAFNGVYLGTRLDGGSVSDAVQKASKAAGTVIQHPGAIIPKPAFTAAMSG